jgi:hypothetical protein
MNLFDVVRMMEENEKESARKSDLLFAAGKETCTDEEGEIIFDLNLTFDEQMAKLRVLRGENAVKPKSFRKRITTTDAIHAKALGSKLN